MHKNQPGVFCGSVHPGSFGKNGPLPIFMHWQLCKLSAQEGELKVTALGVTTEQREKLKNAFEARMKDVSDTGTGTVLMDLGTGKAVQIKPLPQTPSIQNTTPTTVANGVDYCYCIRLSSQSNQETVTVKIGCSKNPEERRKALQTANSMPLELVAYCKGGRSIESALHNEYAQYQTSALNEWFNLPLQVYETLVNKLKAK